MTSADILAKQLEILEDKRENRECSGEGWELEASAYRAGADALREAANREGLAVKALTESTKQTIANDTGHSGQFEWCAYPRDSKSYYTPTEIAILHANVFDEACDFNTLQVRKSFRC